MRSSANRQADNRGAGPGPHDLLVVSEGGATHMPKLTADYRSEFFAAGQDGGTGTPITADGMPCYCRGTRILTAAGEKPIEDLRIGDRLVTRSGAARPLVWIGRRSFSGRFAAANPDVLPVLIRAGALADGVPKRDLLVSPLHEMYLDDVLIPAIALVNGSSILQLEQIEQVEYFHLELETHDVILAEGALSETFVDDNNRGMFDNAAEYARRYPVAVRIPAVWCAPRIEDGPVLETVRRRLANRMTPAHQASAEQETGSPGTLLGYLDTVSREIIRGWARDQASPDRPVRLRVLDNGVSIGELVADRYRGDVAEAGHGHGRHGFELSVPGGLSPLVRHVIQVCRAADGMELGDSPQVLEAAPDAPAVAPVVTVPTGADLAHDSWLDSATRDRIRGWARNSADPRVPVALVILDNGTPIARVLANCFRLDLRNADIGDGHHGFEISIPGGLSPLTRHVISVRRESDGAEIANSPVVIEAAGSFDAALEQAVASAVAALATAGEHERVLSFMLAQADRLRQQQADAEGRRDQRLNEERSRRRGARQAEDPVRRALVVDEQVPATGRDAGSCAILSHMTALRQLGYDVSFVAAGEMAPGEMANGSGATASGATASGATALARLGVTSCGAPFYTSVEEVLRRQAGCFDVVYLHRAEIAAAYLTLARKYFPRARILYGVSDLHHVRLARQAAAEERPELLAASRRLRFAEYTAAWLADAVITHSTAEADLLRRAVPEAAVHHVPWEIPLRPAAVAFARRIGVAFIGNYRHLPNIDAARWLVESIMPLVWQVEPAITCLLVGSNMPAAVRRLAGPDVDAVGQVDDLGADVFDRVRLTVAPLRYGAGLKGKVLESFGAGVPCVMTEIAAEGMVLPPTVQALVGRDASALADLICRMHEDAAANRAAAVAGLALVRQNYGADTIVAGLRAAIEGHHPRAGQKAAG